LLEKSKSKSSIYFFCFYFCHWISNFVHRSSHNNIKN